MPGPQRFGYEGEPVDPTRRALFDVDRRINVNVAELLTKMEWQGSWAPGEYDPNDVVNDDGWAMVCTAPGGCTDKPAPYPTGTPAYLYAGADPTNLLTTKSLMFGSRFTSGTGEAFYLTGFRIYTVIGNDYTVYSVSDPTGTAVVRQLLQITAGTTGWVEFPLDPTLVVDFAYDLVVVASEPDPTPTVFTGNWNYSTPPLFNTPGLGEAIHANAQLDTIRISNFDAGNNNRAAELSTVTQGDVIEFGAIRYVVQAITDQLTFYDFVVAPAQQQADALYPFNFEVVLATPITFLEDVDYWTNNPLPGGGTVQGLFSNPSDYDNITLSGTAYGADLQVQPAVVSDEWEVLASPGGGGGGSGVSDHNDLTGVTADQHHPQLHDLDSHTDVNASAPAGLNVLTWSDLDQEWQPRAPLASIGLSAFAYRFSTDIVGPPNSGRIEFNNADPSLVTEVYIHKDDATNQDIELFLEYLGIGDWCNVGDRSDYDLQHHSYDVSGTPVDNGDWWTIPVTVFENVGLAFTNNEQVNLVIRYTPAPGPQGEKGDPGSKWYTSNGPPDDGNGVDDDQTLDVDSGDVYTKTAGTWVLTGNIKGPKGDTGDQGPQGPVGGTNFSSQWNYGTANAAPPAGGFIEVNHADTVWVHDLDLNGQDVSGQLATVAPGDELWIRDLAGKTEQMTVDATVDSGTYYTFTVTYVAGGGQVVEGQVVFLDLVLKGATSILPGGTTGQAVRKLSNADGDADWQDDPPHVLEGTFNAPPAELELSQLFYDEANEVIDPNMFWYGTQAQYDALGTKYTNTLYVIISAGGDS